MLKKKNENLSMLMAFTGNAIFGFSFLFSKLALDVARSLVFANVTTVISVLAGIVILHEHFSEVQFVGILMVILGVFGVNHYTK